MKKKFFRILIVIFIGVILFENVRATGQAADLLIINRDTFYLFFNPLEPYLESKNERKINGIELGMTSTGCWRGYIATWKIQNDSLFLTKLEREIDDYKIHVFNLKEEFGTDQVLAEWYTGTIFSPRGEMVQYIHMGYSSIYEKEEYYKIRNGIIKSIKSRKNLVFNKKQLYPAESYLNDTISKIIISKLNLNLLKEIPDSSSCILHIQFNQHRKIEKIELGNPKNEKTLFGKSILNIAKVELINLPKLMKVNHKYYSPPYLYIGFSGYCIKNPWDKKYGCTE